MALDELRKPFLVVATALAWAILLLELSADFLIHFLAASLNLEVSDAPGWGILGMAFVDGLLVFRLSLMSLAIVVPARLLGRIQGIATLIGSLILIIVGFVLLLRILGELMLMIALFLAVPFGTAVYLGIWGSFQRGLAATLLGIILALKVGVAIVLVLAQPRFLQIKALILLVLSSFLVNLIVSFLHGLVARPLVSITDAVAAIVVIIIGLIWLILALIGSIPAILAVLRVDKSLAR